MLPLLLLACSLPADTGGSARGGDGDEPESMVQLQAAEPGPTPFTSLSGWLQLEVGFREATVGDRDCILVWTAENAVAIDRCAACDAAFELTWDLDDAASTPGEHCAPVAGPLPMALGFALAAPDPVWAGEPGAPLAPWTPASPLLAEDEGWAFTVGEADVRQDDGGFDTALWTGWVRPE